MGRRMARVVVLLAVVAVAGFGGGPRSVAAEDGGGALWVPTYVQQRNLSCEYAAMTIATAAFGGWVSEYEFDERVGWSANPNWGFRGDINGWWGNTDDYGVYPEALVAPLAELGYAGEVIYGQGDAGLVRSHLDEGLPVVLWLGLWGDLSFYDYAEDGTPFKLTPGYHVVVAYDYDENGVSFSDPATGEYGFYDWGTFMTYWNVLDSMAMAVAPA